MLKDCIIPSAYRLFKILELLHNKKMTRDELMQQLKKFPFCDISNESLRSDIKTLQSSGYDVQLVRARRRFRYVLTDSFVKIGLTFEDFKLLKSIKETALESLSYREIMDLQTFYKRLEIAAPDRFETGVYDFKFFNNLSQDIINKIEEVIEEKTSFCFKYNSPSRGIVEFTATPYSLAYKNSKLYMECSLKGYKNIAKLRTDKIEEITKVMETRDEETEFFERYKAVYVVKKEFILSHYLEDFETVIDDTDDEYMTLQAEEANSFFIVQRILTLGKNCVEIKTPEIEELVIEKLKKTLEVYN